MSPEFPTVALRPGPAGLEVTLSGPLPLSSAKWEGSANLAPLAMVVNAFLETRARWIKEREALSAVIVRGLETRGTLARSQLALLLSRPQSREISGRLHRVERQLREVQQAIQLRRVLWKWELSPSQTRAVVGFHAAFLSLSRGTRAWEVAYRPGAPLEIRTPVRLIPEGAWIFDDEVRACRVGDAIGKDLYLYPGFLLRKARPAGISLFDMREVILDFREARLEEDTGSTPGALIHLRGPRGFGEAYLLSDRARGEKLAGAYERLWRAFYEPTSERPGPRVLEILPPR